MSSNTLRDESFSDRLNSWWAAFQFNGRQRLRIYSKLATLLDKGVPISRALDTIIATASRGDPDSAEPVVIILRDLKAALTQGKKISDALMRWKVPAAEVMVVAAGETGGTLPQALRNASRIAESAGQMKSALVGALAYPVLLLIAATGVMLLYGLYVIPEFQRSVPGVQWRGFAKTIIAMSEFMTSPYAVLAAFAVIGGGWGILASMPHYDGRLRKHLDRIAPWSMYRLATGSAWLIGLGALVEAGMRLELALTTMSVYSKNWLRNRISDTLAGLRSGKNLGEAMSAGGYDFPDREIAEDLAVYSSLGGVDKALLILADEWIKRGTESVKASAAVLNTVAILAMALIVAWLVTGMFDMQQQVQAATKAAAAGTGR